MKKIFFVLISMALTTALYSEVSKKIDKSLLIGKWTWKASDNLQYVMEFQKNGKWKWKSVGIFQTESGGTWTISGNILSCVVENENRTETYEIQLLTKKELKMLNQETKQLAEYIR